MGQRLCAGPEADRIATHHPGAVRGDVPTTTDDGGKTKADEQDHRRARHHADGIEKRAVVVDRGIELRHPQTRKCGDKSEGNQQSSSTAVPTGSPAAYAGGELESTQNAVGEDAENMQYHGHGRREEPRILRCDFRAASKPGQADGAGPDREGAERDQ